MKFILFTILMALLVVAINCRRDEDRRPSEHHRNEHRHNNIRPSEHHRNEHRHNNIRPSEHHKNEHRHNDFKPSGHHQQHNTPIRHQANNNFQHQKPFARNSLKNNNHRFFRSANVEQSESVKQIKNNTEKSFNFSKIFQGNQTSTPKSIFVVNNTETIIDCQFNWRNMSIFCKNLSNQSFVECNVTSTLMKELGKYWHKYNGFAISTLFSKPNVTSHYHLYPHSINESTYFNSTISPNLHIVLHHEPAISSNVTYTGYKIVDGKCWDRFVNLFTAVNKFDFIQVKNVTEKVKTIGYIHFSN